MGDKIKEIDGRLNRLEERLKATFLEVEKRFENMKIDEPAVHIIEQRIQELEDLLLLQQLEITKMKETGTTTEFSPTLSPDIEARLEKIEKEITTPRPDMADRLTMLERRLVEIENQKPSEPLQTHKPQEGSHPLGNQLDDIEGRLNKLEHDAKSIGKGLQDDVRKILEA